MFRNLYLKENIFHSTPEAECKVESLQWAMSGTKASLCFPNSAATAAKSLQSCPTLCDPIDGSTPGSPVPGILQARTLEWVAISSPIHDSEKRK